MDSIREALKKQKRGRTSSPTPSTITTQTTTETVQEPTELVLSDKLLVEYFITHLDRPKVEEYLKTPSDNVRKKLVMADLYNTHYGTSRLYDFLDEPVHLNSWTVFISQSLRPQINDFITSIYREPEIVGKNMEQQIAEDVLNQYLTLDFSSHQRYVSTKDQNITLLLDQMFNLAPAFTELDELRGMVRGKNQHLTDLLNSYNIDIKKDGLRSLYLLDGITELKR